MAFNARNDRNLNPDIAGIKLPLPYVREVWFELRSKYWLWRYGVRVERVNWFTGVV